MLYGNQIKKNIGVMNSKAYAIIEAKASLSMGKGTGPGSLLNDLNKQHNDGRRRKERDQAKKENNLKSSYLRRKLCCISK